MKNYEKIDNLQAHNSIELMFIDEVIQYNAVFLVKTLFRQIAYNICLRRLSEDKQIPPPPKKKKTCHCLKSKTEKT